MRFRTWAPAVVVTLLAMTLNGPAVAVAASVGPVAVPAFAPDVRSPAAEVTGEANDTSGALMSYVEKHPDRYTGVSITGARSILVTLPGGADVAARQADARRALAAATPAGARSVSVSFAQVRYSRAQLSRLKEAVVQQAQTEYRDSVVAVGEDPALGAIVVYLKTRDEQPRIALSARYGDAVVFRHLGGDMRFAEADRDRDTAPHFGGAGYRMWDSSHSQPLGSHYCSTAFPVIFNGVTYMLTAGHCAPGQTDYRYYWASGLTAPSPTPSISYYFGARSTTTISGTVESPRDGTQDLYGDWAIMTGSQYSPAVYNCTNTTGACGILRIGAGLWTTPRAGMGACISGRSSGQVCRFFITDPAPVVTGGPFGLTFRHVAIIRHDANLDGVYDCVPVRGGDSGGAVYQGLAGRPGYVTAMGTVSSVMGDGCASMYTKLSGLKAWNASATMPLAP
jgi:hypothetical protein